MTKLVGSYTKMAFRLSDFARQHLQELFGSDYKNIDGYLLGLETDDQSKIQDPVSHYQLTGVKIIRYSTRFASIMTRRWLLEDKYNKINTIFQHIDYEGISKLEGAAREKTEATVKELAKKADAVTKLYAEPQKNTVSKDSDECLMAIQRLKSSFVQLSQSLLQLYEKVLIAVDDHFDFPMTADIDDPIFRLHDKQDLQDYIINQNIFTLEKDAHQLLKRCAYGQTPWQKFLVLSMTLMVLSAIKRKAQENMVADTENLLSQAKKIAKYIYKISLTAMKKLSENFCIEYQAFADSQAIEALQSIAEEMHLLLLEIESASIPQKHPISKDQAKLVQKLIEKHEKRQKDKNTLTEKNKKAQKDKKTKKEAS